MLTKTLLPYKFQPPFKVLKDCVMAATIKKGLEEQNSEDTALVIGNYEYTHQVPNYRNNLIHHSAGSGHLDYGLGVPERVGHVEGGRCLITSR